MILLVPALVLGRARRYAADFVPFALLIIVYSALRGYAHVGSPVPYFWPQIDAERWLFGGVIPTVELQHWLWSGDLRFFDRFVIVVTKIHGIIPISLGFALWVRRRALFYRFATSFLVLSFASAIVFWLYPAAPPWAAGQANLIDVMKIDAAVGGAGSLPVEQTTVYRLIHANPYAAIPSLHAGYAFLVFLFVLTLTWRTRWRWAGVASVVYPAVQSFAVVYTGNHYVIDLLIGYAGATVVFVAVRALWRRLALPE